MFLMTFPPTFQIPVVAPGARSGVLLPGATKATPCGPQSVTVSAWSQKGMYHTPAWYNCGWNTAVGNLITPFLWPEITVLGKLKKVRCINCTSPQTEASDELPFVVEKLTKSHSSLCNQNLKKRESASDFFWRQALSPWIESEHSGGISTGLPTI